MLYLTGLRQLAGEGGGERIATPFSRYGMRVLLRSLICWLLFIGCGTAFAADAGLEIRRFSQSDGYKDAYIYGVVQDHTGYIYFFVRNGFYYFTGKRFYYLDIPNSGNPEELHRSFRILPDGRIVIVYPKEIFITNKATSSRISPGALYLSPVKSANNLSIKDILVDNSNIYALSDDGIHLCNEFKENTINCNNKTSYNFLSDGYFFQKYNKVFYSGRSMPFIQSVSGSIIKKSNHIKKIYRDSNNPLEKISYFSIGDKIYYLDSSGIIKDIPSPEIKNLSDVLFEQAFFLNSEGMSILYDGNRLRQWNGSYWSYPNYELSREQDLFFAFIDTNQQLWLTQDAVELDKLVGWGQWENYEPHDIHVAWSVLSSRNGRLLFSDTGLFLLSQGEIGPSLSKGNFFFSREDGPNSFWAPVDDTYLSHYIIENDHLRSDMRFPIRRVTGLAIAQSRGTMPHLWIAADEGLFSAAGAQDAIPVPVKDEQGNGLSGPAADVILRPGGQPWALVNNALYSRMQNGRWRKVMGKWPNTADFLPVSMIFTSENDLWIGGWRAKSGLLHLVLENNTVKKVEKIAPVATDSLLVFDLFADRHHRLWVGTENGLLGFDGRVWVRITKEDGLLSNNINQKGISEDRDGSLWITTSRGVSHMRHPEYFFRREDLRPVFVNVRLGAKLLPEKAVPFTRDPLTVTLGTLNTALATTTQFRYRLEGVDESWVTTTTGEIRYNFVPPGHSRLIVQAFNENRNLISKPIVLEIRMQRPWWTSWPLMTFYIISVIGLPYSLNRIRFNYLIKRQHMLESLIDERTAEMRAAQQALEEQARQDGLTRLMNRRTAEASALRLLEKRAEKEGEADDDRSVAVALFDVDYFKSINDTFGHTIGDEILVAIGGRLLNAKKEEEIVGRYGGEEFLIVIPGPFPDAVSRIRTLLDVLTTRPFGTKSGILPIGCSAGVARIMPGENWTDMIERADRALYEAKMLGRGRIVISAKDRNDADYRD